MSNLNAALKKLNIEAVRTERIQEKDGITVTRIFTVNNRYVLKLFEKPEYLREIHAYALLQQLKIPTLRVIDHTECALLLEDVEISPFYRLGRAKDMDNPQIASCLGRWYRHLHDRGGEFLARCSWALYDESDCFTAENMDIIRRKTHTEDCGAWKLYISNCDAIRKKWISLPKTLTYNDFYYTNLLVARDETAAMMFDFNMMGKGYAYSDVRNVCSSLSSQAAEAFLEAYGGYDSKEKYLDDVVAPVAALYTACQREVFPGWGQAVLEEAMHDAEIKLARVLEENSDD